MMKEGKKLNTTMIDRICNTKQNEKDGSFTKTGPNDRAGYKPELSAKEKVRKM